MATAALTEPGPEKNTPQVAGYFLSCVFDQLMRRGVNAGPGCRCVRHDLVCCGRS